DPAYVEKTFGQQWAKLPIEERMPALDRFAAQQHALFQSGDGAQIAQGVNNLGDALSTLVGDPSRAVLIPVNAEVLAAVQSYMESQAAALQSGNGAEILRAAANM